VPGEKVPDLSRAIDVLIFGTEEPPSQAA